MLLEVNILLLTKEREGFAKKLQNRFDLDFSVNHTRKGLEVIFHCNDYTKVATIAGYLEGFESAVRTLRPDRLCKMGQ